MTGNTSVVTRLQVLHVALVQLVPVVRAFWLYTPLVCVLQHHGACADTGCEVMRAHSRQRCW